MDAANVLCDSWVSIQEDVRQSTKQQALTTAVGGRWSASLQITALDKRHPGFEVKARGAFEENNVSKSEAQEIYHLVAV